MSAVKMTATAGKEERVRVRPMRAARPHSKPVDYTAVRKDIMKRYPKVIAELAR